MAAFLPAVVALLTLVQDPTPPAPVPAGAPAPAAKATVQWQRSLTDALAVQQASGLPLLLCVNMDGEVFNDRFATEKYPDPEFAQVLAGYVCLVASPDRHTQTDYDSFGRRVECPRFPGLVCSEHINIEPLLFERFFHGQRAAPRHAGVDKDGKILFDRFLDASMDTAIAAIREHRGSGAIPLLPATVAELLARRDAAARSALERRYLAGDQAAKLLLLQAAAGSKAEPFDLLRMGLRADEQQLFTAAARALAAVAGKDAVIDLEDALARADDAGLQKALVAALDRVGQAGDPVARRIVAHLRAVIAGAQMAVQEPFLTACKAAPAAPAPVDGGTLDTAVDSAERAVQQNPDDGSARLRLAKADFALAEFQASKGNSLAGMLYEDARRAAERALPHLQDDAGKADAHAIQAWVLWSTEKATPAHREAKAAFASAVAAGTHYDAASPLFARALEALGKASATAAFGAAQQDANAMVAEAVQDAAAAFAVLSAHPYGSEALLLDHMALLEFAGARGAAAIVLEYGVRRYGSSPKVHEQYRIRVIQDRGAEALRARYRQLVADAAHQPTMQWFAGYAAIVVAELHMKDQRRSDAESAYQESIDCFTKARATAEFADSADHFTVLARAGRALLRYERGDSEGAVQDLVAAAKLRPTSFGESDGLGRKPSAIRDRIERELRAAGKTEFADQLHAGG
ncbi:MAG TPA: hypothetical protein VK348_12185 [Planctomycetota bacterium]|nr:hypothetical protein [Planctomycetota bacterium]